jgi:predicted nucleotidyltransferase
VACGWLADDAPVAGPPAAARDRPLPRTVEEPRQGSYRTRMPLPSDSSSASGITPGLFDDLVEALRAAVPSLAGVWVFGSCAQGTAGPESDLDLAILADAPPDAVACWELAQQLANRAGRPVDLLDLRAASTVMQYQVVHGGRRLWARDVGAGLYESYVLSEKTALDEARAGLLADIAERGTIRG